VKIALFADSKTLSDLDSMLGEKKKIFSPCSILFRKRDGQQDTSGPERGSSGAETKWRLWKSKWEIRSIMPNSLKFSLGGKRESRSTIVTSLHPKPIFMKRDFFRQAGVSLRLKGTESLRFILIHRNPYGWMTAIFPTFE
jgi:hypothetical protein